MPSFADLIKGYHPPQQERSTERVAVIKETALRLFATQGFMNVSTKNIADASNVQVQSLYQYFEEGKDTIAQVLAAESNDALLASVEEVFGREEMFDASAAEIVQTVNTTFKAFYREHPAAVLTRFAPDIPPVFKDMYGKLAEAVMFTGAAYLERRGLGTKRFQIAEVVLSIFMVMRQRSIRFDKTLAVSFDESTEVEYIKLLTLYLEQYLPGGKA